LSASNGYQVREEAAPDKALFGVKNDDIAPKNTDFLNIKVE
jgi:hypothetical protein